MPSKRARRSNTTRQPPVVCVRACVCVYVFGPLFRRLAPTLCTFTLWRRYTCWLHRRSAHTFWCTFRCNGYFSAVHAGRQQTSKYWLVPTHLHRRLGLRRRHVWPRPHVGPGAAVLHHGLLLLLLLLLMLLAESGSYHRRGGGGTPGHIEVSTMECNKYTSIFADLEPQHQYHGISVRAWMRACVIATYFLRFMAEEKN